MAKYKVWLHTTASASIIVDVDDDLDPEEAKEQALDQAYGHTPGICAQCSGWGNKRFSLEINEDWEVSEKPNGDWDIEPVEV